MTTYKEKCLLARYDNRFIRICYKFTDSNFETFIRDIVILHIYYAEILHSKLRTICYIYLFCLHLPMKNGFKDESQILTKDNFIFNDLSRLQILNIHIYLFYHFIWTSQKQQEHFLHFNYLIDKLFSSKKICIMNSFSYLLPNICTCLSVFRNKYNS